MSVIASRTTNRIALRSTRALAVASATLAALLVWAVEVSAFGLNLRVQFPSGAPQGVGLEAVGMSALAGSLAGWALLAILERTTNRARTTWTLIAVLALLASLTAPLGFGITLSSKLGLALLHLTVAAVLVPALRRT